MSHNQIANELGTAREVITGFEKLENEGKVVQNSGEIKISAHGDYSHCF
jgi:hypothetical protein